MLFHRIPWSVAGRLTRQPLKREPLRWFSTQLGEKIKVAIVGSGPSGCYTAKYLKATVEDTVKLKIDVIEKLPTPFGLVRSGVAPDHPDVKNVQNDFSALFEDKESISFLGNVCVGQDVSLEELRELYDVVVLAYGCQSDRKLGIPGEDSLSGILCAREFVAWYNGHPEFDHVGEIVASALSSGGADDPGQATVVVVGQGNVALDCARILAKGRSGLMHTDITSRSLNVLQEGVKQTVVVGRRGHVQASFTIKELRELVNLSKDGFDTAFVVHEEELNLGATEATVEELSGSGSRPKVRLDKLLRQAAGNTATASPKEIAIRFLLNPTRFEPRQDDPNSLGAVVCERTRLEGEPGKQVAVGTGSFETLNANLALVSIGYKGIPLPGMKENGWFDERRGIATNEVGRIALATKDLAGVYTSGWLKRGPSGIIGTNIPDAKLTVSIIMEDLPKQTLKQPTTDLQSLLESRSVDVVDWTAYQRIESAEESPDRKRDERQPREKIVDLNELLAVALPK